MTELIQITRVEPLAPHWLRLWFSDGSVHEVDVGDALEWLRGIVDVRSDPARFARVRVVGGTIEWPGGLDLDPVVLHGDFEPVEGQPYPRRIIRGPRTSQPA
jgi:hypothetical protein